MARRRPSPSDTSAASFVELGRPSLRSFGRLLDEERRKRLKGTKKFKRLREMAEVDSTIGGFLNALTLLLGRVDLFAKPADDCPDELRATAEALAKRTMGAFEDMEETPADMRHEMVYTAARDGAAVYEVTWKICRGPDEADGMFRSDYSDGLITWRSWGIRPLESIVQWHWSDRRTRVEGFTQQCDEDFRMVDVPWSKCFSLRLGSLKNSPEGSSMIAVAERDQYFVMHHEETEAIGIRRELCGMPVARVPSEIMSPAASSTQRAAYEQAKNIVALVDSNELNSLVWPHAKLPNGQESCWDIGLMPSAGSRAIDVGAVIQRLRKQIAIALGGGFLFTGFDGVGAKSLDESKQDLFKLACGSILRAQCDMLSVATADLWRRQPVPPPRAAWPVWDHGPLNEVTLAEFAAAWSQMSSVVTVDDAVDNRFRELSGVAPLEVAQAPAMLAGEDAPEIDASTETKAAPPAALSADDLAKLIPEREVRTRLGMGKAGVRKLVREGRLTAYDLGSRGWRYQPEDVARCVADSAVVFDGEDDEAA